MNTLWNELRFAIRIFLREPMTALVAVASLAAGIAATTVIFSVVYTVLLAPPAYRDARRLVVLWEMNQAKGIGRSPVAPATFRDWRQAREFERLELVAPGSPVTITGVGVPERANIQYATPGLFSLLGVQPAMGRGVPEGTASTNAILISYAFWERHFGKDATAIGSKIVVNGVVRTVSGVLPPRFSLFESSTDLWIPIAPPDAKTEERTFRSWLIAVGRLNPGATRQSAQAEMDVLARGIAEAHPGSNQGWGVRVESIQEAQFGGWKNVLYLLSGAVLALLAIACANVASLFLGRVARRRRELLVRASLGATRFRLIRQLLVEGLVIGGFGCAAGVLLSGWGIRLFTLLAPTYFPLLQSVAINGPVLLFAIAISLASGLALAVVPALVASRTSLHPALVSGGRTSSGLGHVRYRNLLVVAEISLSVVLLVTAGLMLHSAARLIQVDRGFQTGNVLTLQMFLTGPRYVETRPDGVHIAADVEHLYSAVLDRVNALPGVEAAALVSWLPQMGYNTGRRDRSLRIEGLRDPIVSAAFNAVSSRYFQTLRIPLLAGRDFSSRDTESAPWAAIVNQAFAERYWPGQDPIGKQLLIEGERPRIVVGVAGNVRQISPESPAMPELFAPFSQQSPVAPGHGYQNRVHMNIVVRSTRDAQSTAGAVRAIAAAVDNTQPVFAVRTMDEVVADAMSFRRLHTSLLALAAAGALLLAAIGIYGVMSQSVYERTAEIGLRLAVGATQGDICVLVAKQALKLTAAGMVCGLGAALTLGRVVTVYLYGVSAHDPLTMATVSGLLLAIAAAAIWSPVRRAIRTDPIQSLRYE